MTWPTWSCVAWVAVTGLSTMRSPVLIAGLIEPERTMSTGWPNAVYWSLGDSRVATATTMTIAATMTTMTVTTVPSTLPLCCQMVRFFAWCASSGG